MSNLNIVSHEKTTRHLFISPQESQGMVQKTRYDRPRDVFPLHLPGISQKVWYAPH